jgi:hypothetical protein
MVRSARLTPKTLANIYPAVLMVRQHIDFLCTWFVGDPILVLPAVILFFIQPQRQKSGSSATGILIPPSNKDQYSYASRESGFSLVSLICLSLRDIDISAWRRPGPQARSRTLSLTACVK